MARLGRGQPFRPFFQAKVLTFSTGAAINLQGASVASFTSTVTHAASFSAGGVGALNGVAPSTRTLLPRCFVVGQSVNRGAVI